jgi:phage gp45-like
MYTRMGKQKLGNTLIEYSSGSGATFGNEKHLITTADSLRNLHDEHSVHSKSQPSSNKKKKGMPRLGQTEIPSCKDAIK